METSSYTQSRSILFLFTSLATTEKTILFPIFLLSSLSNRRANKLAKEMRQELIGLDGALLLPGFTIPILVPISSSDSPHRSKAQHPHGLGQEQAAVGVPAVVAGAVFVDAQDGVRVHDGVVEQGHLFSKNKLVSKFSPYVVERSITEREW